MSLCAELSGRTAKSGTTPPPASQGAFANLFIPTLNTGSEVDGMIEGDEIHAVLDAYGIELVGSHPPLDVCDGVVEEGFSTTVVCQRSRERTYERYFRTRGV